MGLLALSELSEGMVLACEVTNKHGNVLFKKGDILSAKGIMLLKSWGINEVEVEGYDRDVLERKEMDSLPAGLLNSIEKELREIFPDVGDNPVMKELFRLVKKIKIKQAEAQFQRWSDGSE